MVDIPENHTSPLHHAAFAGTIYVVCELTSKGQAKILSLLLEKKAEVNSKDNEGASALHKAVYNGIYFLRYH